MTPPLTPEARARLRELAGKATPGPWEAEIHGRACECLGRVVVGDGSGPEPDICYLAERGLLPREEPHNGHFIAAANPAAVLAMLDALDATEQDAKVDREWFLETVASLNHKYQTETKSLRFWLDDATKRIAAAREALGEP